MLSAFFRAGRPSLSPIPSWQKDAAMSRFPRKFWEDMTTADFAALDSENVVAVLPVAAIEQHGPHLPVSVDAAIVNGIVRRIIELLPDDLPVTFLPTMPIGKSNEHTAFPGTLSLSAETLIRLWTEIGESVARSGIRRLVLLNSHGGQPQIMDIVARDLRVRLKMFAVALNYWAVGMPDGLFPPVERMHGIHGGSSETSLMLHLRPELVRNEERRDFVSESIAMAKRYEYLRPEGAGIAFGWQTQDLNEHGACGNALDADAQRGQKIVEHVAPRIAELLREVAAFPLSSLRDR
jgi:creatinine amidohydrolase